MNRQSAEPQREKNTPSRRYLLATAGRQIRKASCGGTRGKVNWFTRTSATSRAGAVSSVEENVDLVLGIHLVHRPRVALGRRDRHPACAAPLRDPTASRLSASLRNDARRVETARRSGAVAALVSAALGMGICRHVFRLLCCRGCTRF